MVMGQPQLETARCTEVGKARFAKRWGSPAELAILTILVERGPSSPQEIARALPQIGGDVTKVKLVLNELLKKGCVQ